MLPKKSDDRKVVSLQEYRNKRRQQLIRNLLTKVRKINENTN